MSRQEVDLNIEKEPYPYVHYDVMGNAPTFVNAYCNTKSVMSALTKALYGEIPFEGVSPVDLENCAMY